MKLLKMDKLLMLTITGYWRFEMGLFDDKHGKDVSSKARADIAFSKAISKAFAQELKALLFRKSKNVHIVPTLYYF